MLQKRCLALVLVLAMLCSLCACVKTAPVEPSTTPTTPPTTPPTTLPPPTEPPAADRYAAALEKLQQLDTVRLAVSSKRTVTVADTSFQETSKQEIHYTGLGTDQFQAYVKDDVHYGSYSVSFEEIFADGTVYIAQDELAYFQSTATAAQYMARFAPVVLVDAALYSEPTGDENTILFSGATQGESWLVPEEGQFVQSSGSATLNDQGELVGYSYQVTYAINGAQISYDITTEIFTDSVETKTVTDPAPYIPLEFGDGPRLVEQATGYLLQLNGNRDVTALLTDCILSNIAGVVYSTNISMNLSSTDGSFVGEVVHNVSMTHPQGSDEYKQTERLIGGKYTMEVDGEVVQSGTGVSAGNFRSFIQETLLDSLFPGDQVVTATATDLGSLYYLELTYTEELCKSLDDYICQTVLADPSQIESLSTGYRCDSMTGYLSIDKYTGLPVAFGSFFEGTHTIQGSEYSQSIQNDVSLDLLSTSAYETVTGQAPQTQKPEESAAPLFYHVTGADGQEMWLLGTIHVGDSRTSHLPQEIYTAFDAADALAVEFDMHAFETASEEDEDLIGQMGELYFYSDGSQISDHLEQDLAEYALMLMKATGNYSMNAPYMKPYFWGNAIDNFFLRHTYSLSATQGVDNQLLYRAEKQGKTVLDVESGLSQLEMMAEFSEDLQVFLLMSSVGTDPLESARATQELFEMWCTGDEEALITFLNTPEDTTDWTPEEVALLEEYNNAMGPDRNDDMLRFAIDCLEGGDTVFYAVGLAHLLAQDGLVNTLRDAGYTVELVSFK